MGHPQDVSRVGLVVDCEAVVVLDEPFEALEGRCPAVIVEERLDILPEAPPHVVDDRHCEVGLRREEVVEAPLLHAGRLADLGDADTGVAAAKPEPEGAVDQLLACVARTSHS